MFNRLFNQKIFVFIIIIFIATFFLYVRSWETLIRLIDDTFHASIAKNLTKHWHLLELRYNCNIPYLEKPPLLILLSALGQIIFGYTSFGARFFLSLSFLIGLIFLFKFLLNEYELKYAFWASLILITTQQILFYARRIVPDASFTIFLTLGLIYFFKGRENHKYLFLSSIWVALSILFKGTAGLLYFWIIGLYIIFSKEWHLLKTRAFYFSIILTILIIFPWHLAMYLKYKNEFIKIYFWQRQLSYFFPDTMGNAQWGWETNFKKILENYWPWLPFFLFYSFKSFQLIKNKGLTNKENRWFLFLLIWIVAIFTIFQIANGKRYVYILPIYPAMALLIGYFISKSKWELLFKKAIILLISLYSLACVFTNSLILSLDDSAWQEHKPILNFINEHSIECGKKLCLYPVTTGHPWLTDGYTYYTRLEIVNLKKVEELKSMVYSKTPICILTDELHFNEVKTIIKKRGSILLKAKNLILLKYD